MGNPELSKVRQDFRGSTEVKSRGETEGGKFANGMEVGHRAENRRHAACPAVEWNFVHAEGSSGQLGRRRRCTKRKSPPPCWGRRASIRVSPATPFFSLSDVFPRRLCRALHPERHLGRRQDPTPGPGLACSACPGLAWSLPAVTVCGFGPVSTGSAGTLRSIGPWVCRRALHLVLRDQDDSRLVSARRAIRGATWHPGGQAASRPDGHHLVWRQHLAPQDGIWGWAGGQAQHQDGQHWSLVDLRFHRDDRASVDRGPPRGRCGGPSACGGMAGLVGFRESAGLLSRFRRVPSAGSFLRSPCFRWAPVPRSAPGRSGWPGSIGCGRIRFARIRPTGVGRRCGRRPCAPGARVSAPGRFRSAWSARFGGTICSRRRWARPCLRSDGWRPRLEREQSQRAGVRHRRASWHHDHVPGGLVLVSASVPVRAVGRSAVAARSRPDPSFYWR
jgi:hypothetical protein